MAQLPADAYLVSWRVVSADGHPISGAFTFSVASAGAATPEPSPAVADPLAASDPLLPARGASKPRLLRRAVGMEAAVLVLAVGATGYLVGQNPSTPDSTSTSSTSTAAATPVARTVPLGEAGEVTWAHDPGAVGPNTVQVTRIGAGAYRAEQDLTLSGTWLVEARVRTSRFAQPIAIVEVPVR